MPPSAAAPARQTDPYSQVRQLLVRGQIPPGARASEAALADRLDVSRTPVREAIHRLLTEGLLVTDGGGERPRVAAAPVGVEDAEDLYQAAGAIEGIIARRVTRLSVAERRALASEMRARHAAFRRATRSRPLDYDLLFERHGAFHKTLHDACAGPSLRALLALLQPRLDRYEWIYAPLVGPNFTDTHVEHAAIIRAVAAGSAAAAERAARANAFNSAKRIMGALAKAARHGSEYQQRASC